MKNKLNNEFGVLKVVKSQTNIQEVDDGSKKTSQRKHFGKERREEKLEGKKHFYYNPKAQNDLIHIQEKEINRYHHRKQHMNQFEIKVDGMNKLKKIIYPDRENKKEENGNKGKMEMKDKERNYSKMMKQKEMEGNKVIY